MKLMITGPPGAGKGTQSQLLCERFNLSHLSTGEVLREAVQAGTELGRKADAIMRAGDLVPDELILKMVSQWLAERGFLAAAGAPAAPSGPGSGGFLLDGFPRTLEQAKGLERCGIELDAVILLQLADDDIVKRLSDRRVHLPSGRIYHLINNPPKRPGLDDETGEKLVQRPDDRPEIIRNRLETYRTQTEPMLQYYHDKSVPWLQISGEGRMDEIADNIQKELALLKQSNWQTPGQTLGA